MTSLILGEQEIKALQVKCNNDENGCGWKGELRSLDNHLTTCGYALLRCTKNCTNNKQEVYVFVVISITISSTNAETASTSVPTVKTPEGIVR